jgi:hypothetical protein
MANESFVQVAVDGAGKQVDTFIVSDPVTNITKHRQTVVIGDPSNPFAVSSVENNALVVDDMINSEGEEGDEILKLILIELRIQTYLIASEFRTRDDIIAMRNDPSLYNQ